MSEFLFIRHGATRGNKERRYIGRTDEPVCEPVSVTFEMPEGDFKLFVSPRLRCRQTALMLFPGKEAEVIDDLRECDFGIFEGKTAQELSESYEYTRWVDGGCMGEIPGGDSVTEFRDRCCRAFIDITRRCDGFGVIVTHGGVIMSVLERFGMPKRGFYDYHLQNGGWLLRSFEAGKLTEKNS